MQQAEVGISRTSRRGSSVYFAASLLSQVSALIRYTTLARLLGPEQIGLASVLIITASFFDLVTSTESERFIIQDRDGNDDQVQGLVQLVLSSRGAIVAACLAGLAWPIAAFYHRPELGPALAILSLSPLVLGFLHLDMHRAQRVNDFRPEAYSVLVSETVSLAATLIAAFVVRNFTAVLYGMIARSAVMVLMSHLQAERGYALILARPHVRRLAAFGVPLMLNGALLFFGSQGDRIMVGRALGLTALGHYSAVILLVAYPAAVMQRYCMAIYLPSIAAEQDAASADRKVGDLLGGQTLLLSLAMAAGFAVIAPPMVVVLYGRGFALPALVVALIGVLQTSRFMILWPTTVALGMGKSANILASNIVRLIALPIGAVGGYLIGGLEGVVLGFTVGELLSVAVATVMLNLSNGDPLLHKTDRLVLFVLGCGAILAWVIEIERGQFIEGVLLACASAALIAWIVRREIVTIRDAYHSGLTLMQTRLHLRPSPQK